MSRLIRRAALILALASMLMSATVSGPSTAAASRQQQALHTLTLSWDTNPDSLNPALTGYLIVDQMDRNVFDTLTWETIGGKVSPYLATSWKITNGGKTYIFTLRRGVKFSD